MAKKEKSTNVLDRAIGILSFIPEDKFTVGYFGSGGKKFKHCSLGWLNLISNGRADVISTLSKDVEAKVDIYLRKEFKVYCSIATINDKNSALPEKYDLPTPKKRVLAVLRDARKAGY